MSEPPIAADSPPTLEFGPSRGWRMLDLGELWRYRELLWVLALRDVRVRYKQTIIGVAWAVLQPVLLMVVFTALFQLLGKVPASGAVPYAVTLYCALLPWNLFAHGLTQSSESLVQHQHLIQKVYFPRAVLPIAATLTGLVDFACAFVVLIGLMVYHDITPTWAVVTLPLLILLTMLASLSIALWLSALTALYRDFRIVVPFLMQLGFFISPVIFETTELVPESWRAVYSLNPMVGVLEGFRWALLGQPQPPLVPMLVSTGAVALLLVGGMFYFRRMERLFADRV